MVELKKLVIANAIATGNTYAFHDLFSCLKESSGASENETLRLLTEKLAYMAPDETTLESPKFKAALELTEKHGTKDNSLPALLLEETAKEAVARGKFAYAEDAYKLLGIKNEMVALYAQAGEQFLREDKPKQAATAFFVAASIDQSVGPHYQYLGPELHSRCAIEPKKCVTEMPIEAITEQGIRFLLAHDTLAQQLMMRAAPGQRPRILATLAACRDIDISETIKNLHESVSALLKIENGKPDDYSAIGPILLGRPTSSGQSWQYLKELCFEHPIASLCVCMRPVRNTFVLVPAIREGKSLIDLLLPPEC
ncbi:hypothetical protein HZA56_01805 [Candidatus Poribacteria bacterium]|nr:hypothetical protein [Candidatus Poribacteria bacterium]